MDIVEAPIGHDQDHIAAERGMSQIIDDGLGVVEMACILASFY